MPRPISDTIHIHIPREEPELKPDIYTQLIIRKDKGVCDQNKKKKKIQHKLVEKEEASFYLLLQVNLLMYELKHSTVLRVDKLLRRLRML